MSKNTARFIDFKALKSAVRMEQVLAHYKIADQFKAGKDSLSGPCPIHKGTHATQFRVSLSKNCWNCFSDCHCGGNVLDFVAKMEKVDASEAANLMVAWFDLDIDELNAESDQAERSNGATSGRESKAPANRASSSSPPARPPPAKATPPAQPEINKPLSFVLKLDPAHPYLAERGLMPETVKEFGLGYCDKGVMSERIAIPIHNVKGELVGYAGRWPGEPPEERPKYRMPDGFKKASEVYRLAQAMKEPASQPLIVVEGFFDAMKLWQIGCRKTVALMGSTLSAGQEYLISQAVKPDRTVIVMFDEDEAGRTGREEVLRRLATRMFVRVIVFERENFQPEHLTRAQATALRLTPA
jgi:DNA primase